MDKIHYRKNLFFFLSIAFALTGCFISAGTHGSLKAYGYNVKKDDLQRAVMAVIKTNPNIYRDTSLDYLGSSHLLDNEDSASNDAAGENFYNDIKHYLTIKIKSEDVVNEYTFRYYGADEDWKTANNSELFICYAYDKEHKGGSEGNGGVSTEMLSGFTNVFEKEFINKVDQQLHVKHNAGQ